MTTDPTSLISQDAFLQGFSGAYPGTPAYGLEQPAQFQTIPGLASGTLTQQAMQGVRQQESDIAQRQLIEDAAKRENIANLGVSAMIAGTQLASVLYKPKEQQEIEAETEQLIEDRANNVAATDPKVAALMNRAAAEAARSVKDLEDRNTAMLAGMGDTTVGAQQRVQESGMRAISEAKTDIGLQKAEAELQAAAARDERIYQGLAGEIQDKQNVANALAQAMGGVALQAGKILGEKPLEVPDAEGLRRLGYTDDQITDIVRTSMLSNRQQNSMYSSYLYAGQFGPTSFR